MILEAIVTTLAPDETGNIAPMGARLGRDPRSFILQPYRTSATYQNLKARGEGVLHVTDDVLLIARAAISTVTDIPSRPADQVQGRILAIPGRYREFRVLELDDRSDRTTIRVESVAEGESGPPLFGLNRAKHAVIEAAVLATRLEFLPVLAILTEYDRLAPVVTKTGGPDERLAFGLLIDHVRKFDSSQRRDSTGLRVE